MVNNLNLRPIYTEMRMSKVFVDNLFEIVALSIPVYLHFLLMWFYKYYNNIYLTDPMKKKTEKVLHDLQKKSNCSVAYICTLKVTVALSLLCAVTFMNNKNEKSLLCWFFQKKEIFSGKISITVVGHFHTMSNYENCLFQDVCKDRPVVGH